jgi:type I restriction enzyme M protein
VPRLTQQQLEAHLWGAANILRGRTAGQDYKTYILSLMFFKRLSDPWDYEAGEKVRQFEAERGRSFSDAQRQALRARGDLQLLATPGTAFGPTCSPPEEHRRGNVAQNWNCTPITRSRSRRRS